MWVVEFVLASVDLYVYTQLWYLLFAVVIDVFWWDGGLLLLLLFLSVCWAMLRILLLFCWLSCCCFHDEFGSVWCQLGGGLSSSPGRSPPLLPGITTPKLPPVAPHLPWQLFGAYESSIGPLLTTWLKMSRPFQANFSNPLHWPTEKKELFWPGWLWGSPACFFPFDSGRWIVKNFSSGPLILI